MGAAIIIRPIMTAEESPSPLFSPEPLQEAIGKVAVDRAIDHLLTYRIASHWTPLAKVGSRVRVPLGRGNQLVDGVLVEMIDAADRADGLKRQGWKMKSIAEIDDRVAPIPTELIDLARWTSQYYLCPLGLVLSSMIPAAAKRQVAVPTRDVLCLAPDAEIKLQAPGLSRQAKAGFDRLRSVLRAAGEDCGELRTVMAAAGISRLILRRLLTHGVVIRKKIRLTPNPAGSDPAVTSHVRRQSDAIALTDDQRAAWEEIHPLLEKDEFAVRLLYGVTGSGKTELYLRALERVIERGRRGIVLIPDISLTTHMVDRFIQRFEKVVVLHSGMSESTRHQHWQAAASGWADVVIGTRSAIFAPVPNCGLIVVDEEHDPGFKQDNTPRYHARDVAIRRAQLSGIPILLGSATPSLESWHNSETLTHFKRVELLHRPASVELPEVILVDMHAERRKRKGICALSMRLEAELKAVIQRGRQAILLLNRRGWAHYVGCSRCDWSLNCEHCDAHMVVHHHRASASRAGRYVQCHYCLTSRILPTLCPACGAKLIELGQGTQRVQEELEKLFSSDIMIRMDGDSMRNLDDYRRALRDFEQGTTRILLGTQMVAKGLDFPGVGLVGVLDADMAQSSPDFRAAERTFDLISQVAGRCGRRDEKGRVIVQTSDVRSAAIIYASRHDYRGFVASELPHRKAFGYPPFCRMARLVISHKERPQATEMGRRLAEILIPLAEKEGCRWQGPQNPPMEFQDDWFRIEFIMFGPIASNVQRTLTHLRREPIFQELSRWLTVDVDPVNLR